MSILVSYCRKCDENIACLNTDTGDVTHCTHCRACHLKDVPEKNRIPLEACSNCRMGKYIIVRY